MVDRLVLPEYDAAVQRGVLVTVTAFAWNCQQHIAPRFTAAELEPVLARMQPRIGRLATLGLVVALVAGCTGGGTVSPADADLVGRWTDAAGRDRARAAPEAQETGI